MRRGVAEAIRQAEPEEPEEPEEPGDLKASFLF